MVVLDKRELEACLLEVLMVVIFHEEPTFVPVDLGFYFIEARDLLLYELEIAH
jgi:hypothetical protein